MQRSDHELDARIARATEHLEGIGTLAVFGSRAGGRPRPDSDLDVAILPTGADPTDRRALLARAAAALADLAPGGRVDVVFVDEAPELLRQRVFEHGRIVTQRDPAAWRLWRIRTMREHGDREPFRRLLRLAQRRRLEEDTRSGRSGRALDSLERTRGLPG